MDYLDDISLIDGPFFWTVASAGLAGGIFLLVRRAARWLLAIACAVALGVGVVSILHWLFVNVLLVFPEDLPLDVLAWTVVAFSALWLFLFRLRSSSWRRKTAAIGSVIAVVLFCALQVNRYFGLNHTVADLLGHNVARIPDLEARFTKGMSETKVKPETKGTPGALPPASAITPVGTPEEGIVRRAQIPGTASGFKARDAYVYLPPAYIKANHAQLPVLVLIAGQPGRPADWLTGGLLESTMNSFAAKKGGVAPVVVVVDPNGSDTANTMCMDSRIALADSYLAVDVPRWINANLKVSADPLKWAVGGFSFGGTCAMQMVTMHPDRYSAFIAFSGEREPSLGPDHSRTIATAFGGDSAAFHARTPLNLMRQRSYAGHAGFIAVGSSDGEFTAFANELAQAARDSEFDLKQASVAGAGHSWSVAVQELPSAMDFLAPRWGLTP